MNHNWGKLFKEPEGYKSKVCRVCGCKKSIAHGIELHIRSGIVFKRMPDCIDEEFENTKTID